jgi:hypothetical protein
MKNSELVNEKINYLNNSKDRCLEEISVADTLEKLRSIERHYIGAGRTVLNSVSYVLRNLSPEDRVVLGKELNRFVKDIIHALKARDVELFGEDKPAKTIEVPGEEKKEIWAKANTVDFAGCDEGFGQTIEEKKLAEEGFEILDKALDDPDFCKRVFSRENMKAGFEAAEKEDEDKSKNTPEQTVKMFEDSISVFESLLDKEKSKTISVDGFEMSEEALRDSLEFSKKLKELGERRKELNTFVSSPEKIELIKEELTNKELIGVGENDKLWVIKKQPELIECKSGIRSISFDRSSVAINEALKSRLVNEQKEQKHYVKDLVSKLFNYNFIDKADELLNKAISALYFDSPKTKHITEEITFVFDNSSNSWDWPKKYEKCSCSNNICCPISVGYRFVIETNLKYTDIIRRSFQYSVVKTAGPKTNLYVKLVNHHSGLISCQVIDRGPLEVCVKFEYDVAENSMERARPPVLQRTPYDFDAGITDQDLRQLEKDLEVIDARNKLSKLGLMKVIKVISVLSRPSVRLAKKHNLTNNKIVSKAVNFVEALKVIV